MVGVIAAVDLRLLLPLLVSWFVVLVLWGYVGLATMLSGVALVVAVYVLEPAQRLAYKTSRKGTGNW